MKKKKGKNLLRTIFLGNRYSQLNDVNEQVRYMTMNWIFMVATLPLVILGITLINVDITRTFIDFGIAFLCLLSLILIRSKIPLKYIPIFPVTVFGAYCCYLLYLGDLNLWAAIWIFSFPPIVIFLCQMVIGVIESIIVLVVSVVFLYSPLSSIEPVDEIKIRFLGAYVLIASLSIIYERISILKDRKETELKAELAQEKDIIQTMKDNINQGIFLMDKDLNILPQYSSTLISILSYHSSDLTGKNFLDIISGSFDTKQLKILKSYFNMIFSKEKNARVLDSANPIAEFEYKIDDSSKFLSTKFKLIEFTEDINQKGTTGTAEENSAALIIGMIQDISREKEIENELHAQKEAQEVEMKNLFDVIKIDPMVFQTFVEDTEINFNNINALLKDQMLNEKQVVTGIFQYVHAIKSNAVILDLESLTNKLHVLEDHIKTVSGKEKVSMNDVLSLAIKIEAFMQEMDSYIAITKKINAYKTTNQMDTLLVNSLTKAAAKLAGELKKNVKLKPGHIDVNILESKLRKPVRDILSQCVRNSIYHGIEPEDVRIKKGKNPCGIMSFSINNVDGKAVVSFSDDGAGLDWKKIEKKYLEKNPGKSADRKVLLNCIFLPEFSTADDASSAAGRGVGLSYVKDLVKENKGTISANSTESGLAFKFIFPLKK